MAATCRSGKGRGMYAGLYLPRWLGPERLSDWVACSQGITRTLVVGRATGGIPASSAARKLVSRAGSDPETWVVMVTAPAATWLSLSTPNSWRAGLFGALFAVSQRPKLRSRVAKDSASSRLQGHVVLAICTVCGGAGRSRNQ